MQITKLKIAGDGDEVQVDYLGDRAGGEEEVTFKSDQAPHPDLLTPFKALLPHVLSVLGFYVATGMEPGEDLDDWTFRSMRFKTKGEKTDVEFTVLRVLPTSTRVLTINTPGYPIIEHGDSEDVGPLPAAMRNLIRKVRKEAKEYVDGKRSQGELPLETDEAA